MSAQVQEKRTTTAVDRWFKISNVVLHFKIICLENIAPSFSQVHFLRDALNSKELILL